MIWLLCLGLFFSVVFIVVVVLSLLTFNEEFIFFVIFIIFIYIIHKYYGSKISESLDNYSEDYNYNLIKLVSAYDLRIYNFSEYITDLCELEVSVVKIYSYILYIFDNNFDVGFAEFTKFFYIFKDWTLKLVIQEVLEFVRQLYYKYFLLYKRFVFDLVSMEEVFCLESVDTNSGLLNYEMVVLDFLLFEEVFDFVLIEEACDYFSLKLINNGFVIGDLENFIVE